MIEHVLIYIVESSSNNEDSVNNSNSTSTDVLAVFSPGTVNAFLFQFIYSLEN